MRFINKWAAESRKASDFHCEECHCRVYCTRDNGIDSIFTFARIGLSRTGSFANIGTMGYEDRDYYRERPRLEFSGAMGRGTLTLLIIVAAGYFVAVIVGNSLSFVDSRWIAEVFVGDSESAPNARLAYLMFVLTGRDVAPWVNAYTIQPWKIFTSWLVEPTLFSMVLALIGVYFVGRAMEDLLGARRLLLAVFALSAISALCAAIVDPLLLPHRISVIMGVHAALLGLMTPLCWIYPRDQLIFTFRARSFIAVLIVAMVGLNALLAVVSPDAVIQSPSQPAFAVLAAAGFTLLLKKRGRLPNMGGEEDDRASWGRPVYRPEGEERGSFFSPPGEPDAEVKERSTERAEKAKVDALLEKISRNGIHSLSKSERDFLDSHSRRLKR